MIIVDKNGQRIELRNIQEQVEKNKKDIAAFRSAETVLADFGITVLGHIDSEQEIPQRTYQYGDAYLIGTELPYDMWIFTRTDVEGEGEFVNLGPIAITGPQGPKGDPGENGVDGINGLDGVSIKGTYGTTNPIIQSTNNKGDIYINTVTQHLWMFNGTSWKDLLSIKGETGDTGSQGPQGATGTTLSIVNKLSSSSLLPTNFSSGTILKNSAYLIPDANGNNHLWIILGEQNDYSTWHWVDAGDFNLGSVIYNNGVFVYDIDISNYQRKINNSTEIVVDTDDDKLYLHQDITNKLARTLVTPMATPTEDQLVGVATNNTQKMFNVSDFAKSANQIFANSNTSVLSFSLVNCTVNWGTNDCSALHSADNKHWRISCRAYVEISNRTATPTFVIYLPNEAPTFTESRQIGKAISYKLSASNETGAVQAIRPMYINTIAGTRQINIGFNETHLNVPNGAYLFMLENLDVNVE